MIKTLLAPAAGYSALAGQNSDVGFLAGVSGPITTAIAGTNLTERSVGPSYQVNFAVLQRRNLDFHIELPLMYAENERGFRIGTVSAALRSMISFTPGLRLRIPLASRLSTYGAAGGGVAFFSREEVRLDNGIIVFSRSTTGLFDFAGGLDLRVTRLLSLRGEARDFVTASRVAGASGRNHPVYQFGIGLHF